MRTSTTRRSGRVYFYDRPRTSSAIDTVEQAARHLRQAIQLRNDCFANAVLGRMPENVAQRDRAVIQAREVLRIVQAKEDREFVKAFTPNRHGEYA